MEQERLAVIEKDNRLLLDRIANIMRTKGCVDNWNECYIKSLNDGKRNRDMVKISMENQAFNKRLQEGKGYYDHKKWEEEWQEKKPDKIPSIANSGYKEFKSKSRSKIQTRNKSIEVLVKEVMRDLFSAIDGNTRKSERGEIVFDEIPLCQCDSHTNVGSNAVTTKPSSTGLFPPVLPLLQGPRSHMKMGRPRNRAKKRSQNVISL